MVAYKVDDNSIVNLFDSVKNDFNTYKNSENIEMEMRFGKITKSKFDPTINKNSYERIMKGLLKYRDWEMVKESNTSVYYKNKKRIIVDDDTGDQSIMIKHNIKNINYDLGNSPFDIRFSISSEVDVEDDKDDSDEEMDHVRVKKRMSFIRKNLSIDITQVSGEADDMDQEEGVKYEIELEIVDPKTIKDDVELFNIIYKIRDILKLL